MIGFRLASIGTLSVPPLTAIAVDDRARRSNDSDVGPADFDHIIACICKFEGLDQKVSPFPGLS